MTFDHDLKATVRTIPDYPKKGILFRDITTLLADARAFRRSVDELVQPWAGNKIDKVAGIEARGFILGGAVAHQISAGFVPIRKKGKLPYKRVTIGYSLEYGSDEMEMHEDGVAAGDRVVLVDDLVATAAAILASFYLRFEGDVFTERLPLLLRILPYFVPVLDLQSLRELQAVFPNLPGQIAVAADAARTVTGYGSLVTVRQVQVRKRAVLVQVDVMPHPLVAILTPSKSP
jgi:adenine phosphoribosyltransferase